MTGLVEQEPYLRIKKLFDEKKFDEIITYCQKLLVKDSKNKIALQNISTAYNIVGGYHDAIQSSNKILEADKTDEFALKNKMFANEKLENHDFRPPGASFLGALTNSPDIKWQRLKLRFTSNLDNISN